jgi:hypothetical protein
MDSGCTVWKVEEGEELNLYVHTHATTLVVMWLPSLCI